LGNLTTLCLRSRRPSPDHHLSPSAHSNPSIPHHSRLRFRRLTRPPIVVGHPAKLPDSGHSCSHAGRIDIFGQLLSLCFFIIHGFIARAASRASRFLILSSCTIYCYTIFTLLLCVLSYALSVTLVRIIGRLPELRAYIPAHSSP
jgi:hypothetical protein